MKKEEEEVNPFENERISCENVIRKRFSFRRSKEKKRIHLTCLKLTILSGLEGRQNGSCNNIKKKRRQSIFHEL